MTAGARLNSLKGAIGAGAASLTRNCSSGSMGRPLACPACLHAASRSCSRYLLALELLAADLLQSVCRVPAARPECIAGQVLPPSSFR